MKCMGESKNPVVAIVKRWSAFSLLIIILRFVVVTIFTIVILPLPWLSWIFGLDFNKHFLIKCLSNASVINRGRHCFQLRRPCPPLHRWQPSSLIVSSSFLSVKIRPVKIIIISSMSPLSYYRYLERRIILSSYEIIATSLSNFSVFSLDGQYHDSPKKAKYQLKCHLVKK